MDINHHNLLKLPPTTTTTTWEEHNNHLNMTMEDHHHHHDHDHHHHDHDHHGMLGIAWPSAFHHPMLPTTTPYPHDNYDNHHHHDHDHDDHDHHHKDEDEEEEEELGAMKEMMYRIAVMQPVDIDPTTIRKPKRRNVRISDDPQSVAARLRRERISEKIRILQRLVPGGTKMDTASMLDEAIRYVKFLKRQIRHLQSSAGPGPSLGPLASWPGPTQATLLGLGPNNTRPSGNNGQNQPVEVMEGSKVVTRDILQPAGLVFQHGGN